MFSAKTTPSFRTRPIVVLASVHRAIGGRGCAFLVRHLSSHPRRLPCGVVGRFDADASFGQLDDRRAFTHPQDATSGGDGEVVDRSPLLQREHMVGVRERLALSGACRLPERTLGRAVMAQRAVLATPMVSIL